MNKSGLLVKWAIEYGRFECMDYFADLGLLDSDDIDWRDVFLCIKISRKRNRDVKLKVLEWIKERTGKTPSYSLDEIKEIRK